MARLFTVFPVLFACVFVFVLGMIVFTALRAFSRNQKDERSPAITALARVCGKRSQVNGGAGRAGDLTSMTSYFVTFEFETGDRLELRVPVNEYGYMAEGDSGKLTVKGTRFLGFQREVGA